MHDFRLHGSFSSLLKLVNFQGEYSEALRLATDYDWHILPVANPDGYKWSYERVGYESWRLHILPRSIIIYYWFYSTASCMYM